MDNSNNKIPSSWELIKVSEAGELLRGVNYKKEESSNDPIENYLPVLRANNINGELNFENLVFVANKYVSETQLIKTGDIVFAMSSGSKHLVGKTAKARANFNGGFGAFCSVFRPNENFNKDLIAYFFQAPSYKKLIRSIAKGTNINNLKREHILDLVFPLPPLKEQNRIVEKIEELLSDLDKGIESLEFAKSQLQIYKQSILKWAFEGKLTHKKFIKDELPKGWKLLKLKDLVEDKVGLRRGPFGSAIKKEFFVADGYKVYEQGNAINDDPYRGNYFVDENKYQELIAFKVIPKDLIVSCSGVTLGRISEIPEDGKEGIINQALLRIRLKKKVISNKFFIIHFRAAFFQKKIFDQSQGTAMPNLVSIKEFKEIEMLIPPPDDQELIVQEIENKMIMCSKIEETIENTLQQSTALRYSILKKAFEGKLVKQNPKDETAQKLLERIRKEKASKVVEKKLKFKTAQV